MFKQVMIAAASLLAVAAFAGPKSGLQAGEGVPAFQVVDVSGPHKGEQLCYRCSYGQSAVVAAFIKGKPEKSAALLTELQGVVSKNKGIRSFVVFMGGPELKQSIEKVAASTKVSIPLTFLPQGASADDIAGYKISPEAENTVLFWKQGKVRSNLVNVSSEQAPALHSAAADLMK